MLEVVPSRVHGVRTSLFRGKTYRACGRSRHSSRFWPDSWGRALKWLGVLPRTLPRIPSGPDCVLDTAHKFRPYASRLRKQCSAYDRTPDKRTRALDPHGLD